jgi:hypothetical protein
LQNWSKIEFIFSHKLHIDPLVVRELEFYSIKMLLNEYQDYVEKENKAQEKQQREIDKQQKASNIKSPSYGDFKSPKFDIPKFDIPKY